VYYRHDDDKLNVKDYGWRMRISPATSDPKYTKGTYSVYISLGRMSNPNEFNYDIAYKNMALDKNLTLTWESLPLKD